MKKFIGITVVVASAMNRLEYNKYRGWELPSDENGEDEGYLVEDLNADSNHVNHNGHISWKQKEEIEKNFVEENLIVDIVLENLAPHQQRVVDELSELMDKAEKLTLFINENKFFKILPEAEQERMKLQLSTMECYASILVARINEFEVPTEIQPTILLSFGDAVKAAKQGKKVARKGWNGAGMFAYIVPAASYPVTKKDGIPYSYFGDMVPYREYWALKTAQNDVATWAPSGSDSLAEDWMIVE